MEMDLSVFLRKTMKKTKAIDASKVKSLNDIPNVGPATVADFNKIGIKTPEELKSADPLKLFELLCAKTGVRHDPCTLDVFISAVRFMDGAPAKPWWAYTDERKKMLEDGKAKSQS
jgi:hypothetical protein